MKKLKFAELQFAEQTLMVNTTRFQNYPKLAYAFRVTAKRAADALNPVRDMIKEHAGLQAFAKGIEERKEAMQEKVNALNAQMTEELKAADKEEAKAIRERGAATIAAYKEEFGETVRQWEADNAEAIEADKAFGEMELEFEPYRIAFDDLPEKVVKVRGEEPVEGTQPDPVFDVLVLLEMVK